MSEALKEQIDNTPQEVIKDLKERHLRERRTRLIEQYAGIFRASEMFNDTSNGEVIAAAIRFTDAVIKATEEK